MDCYLCHKSRWMQEKVFGFLRNLLKNYNESIGDYDVFLLLECDGAQELLARLVREKMPKDAIDKMSEHRDHGFQLELDDDPVHTTLGGLWNKKEQRHYVRDILPELFDYALKHSIETNTGDDFFHERMEELQRTLKLSEEEIDIFLF